MIKTNYMNKERNTKLIPKSIKGRYKVLDDAREVLKSEFIGLDDNRICYALVHYT